MLVLWNFPNLFTSSRLDCFCPKSPIFADAKIGVPLYHLHQAQVKLSKFALLKFFLRAPFFSAIAET